MDENKVDGSLQEAQSAGVEAEAQQTAEAVAAQTELAAGATQPAAEPKNDTETEHAAAGKEPEEGKPATGAEAKAADAGAAVPKPDPAAELVVANQRITDISAMLLTAKAEAAAATLGVKPERIKHAVRMAELSGIDPMTDAADATIGEKLQAVIAAIPEMLGSSGTGSSGAFRRQDTTTIDPFSKGFKQG